MAAAQVFELFYIIPVMMWNISMAISHEFVSMPAGDTISCIAMGSCAQILTA
jgi:hypothetical protein